MNTFFREIDFLIRKTKFIKKYKNYIQQNSEYESFLEKADESNDLNSSLWCVEIYDVLNNSDFNKVVKRLYTMKKDTDAYKVSVSYRKSNFLKLQYARVEIDYTSTSLVGSVQFNNDNYIRDIRITKTQINNNEFILCYSFHLKKLLRSYKEIHRFILDNIQTIRKSRHCTFYINDDLFESKEHKEILRLEFQWLRDLFQGILEQLLYTNMGKMYRLPILFNYNLPTKDPTVISELKAPFLTTCYADEKEEQFLHIESFRRYEGCSINRFTFGKTLTESNFLKYFSSYGNEFYYYIFNTIEIAEIERRLGRYFTSLKRKISIQDHKWLINKIRALKERKIPSIDKSDVWINYVDGEKTKENFFNYPNSHKKYLEIYEQYLDYIRSINNLNYDIIILWVTGLTLATTIIGVILTIVLK